MALFDPEREGGGGHGRREADTPGRPGRRGRASARFARGVAFESAVEKYFRLVFRETHRTAGFGSSSDDDDDENEEEEEEENDKDVGMEAADADRSPSVASLVDESTFRRVCAQLRSLQWVGRLEPAATLVLYEQLERHIREMCQGEYEESFLPALDDWVERVALAWLRKLHAPSEAEIALDQADAVDAAGAEGAAAIFATSTASASAYRSWVKRLRFHLYKIFGSLRISELFNMIRRFPDSRPAIVDLRECLKRTHQHREVTRVLRDVFDARLLIPAAETVTILGIYVRTIKCLRLLDSSGVLLESVSGRVKIYLTGRDDTVRKIVEHLTNPDGDGDLFRELTRASDDANQLIQHGDDSDLDEDDEAGGKVGGGCGDGAPIGGGSGAAGPGKKKLWMPDSIDADPTRSSRSRRLSDILSMLVQIYGSKKLFVTEYRTLLAKKLLKSASFDTDQEVETLELLKQVRK